LSKPSKIIKNLFDKSYIISETGNIHSGTAEITYNINYLNNNWQYLLIAFTHEKHGTNGINYLGSSFDLIDTFQNTNLSNYPKDDKINLWKTVFGLKEYYFKKYKPDIIEHFIDNQFSFQKRFSIYQDYFNPQGYSYFGGAKTNCFYLVKNSLLSKVRTPSK
jgi:hypothetical protein